MKVSKHLFLAAAVMTLAACSNDDENLNTNDGQVAAQITAGIDGVLTRAIDQTWEQDEIGVMVTNASASSGMDELYKNVKYTTTSTGTEASFTSDDGIFFQDADETVTFAAYAPYQASADKATLPGTDGVITGSTESQSTRALQKAFDYIYASEATASRDNPRVSFSGENQFRHKMTRLVVVVETSTEDGFAATDVTSGTYTLAGLSHSGEFNVTTGEAQATGSAGAEAWSLSDNSLKTDGETGQCTFTSILYPQTLTGSLVFTATIDGQTYTGEMQPGLLAGYSYTYNITVKKQGLEIGACTIQDWSDGGSSDIVAD